MYFDDLNEEFEDRLSLDSDSGISLTTYSDSNSIDSFSDSSEIDFNLSNSVDEIALGLMNQTPSYIGALMDFTLNGMESDDHYVRCSASIFLWELLKSCYKNIIDADKKVFYLIKSSSKNLFETIVLSMKKEEFSSQNLYLMSGILHYISRSQYGCSKIWQNNSELMLTLFSSNISSLIFYSITTIHNILLYLTKPIILTEQIIEMINLIYKKINQLTLLNFSEETQVKLLTIAIDCLSNIIYRNNLTKSIIILHNGQNSIVHILDYLNNRFNENNNEKLIQIGLKLLKIISTNYYAKLILSENGDFHNLSMKLIHKQNYQTNCLLFIIRNLSDVMFKENHNEIMLENICQILTKTTLIGNFHTTIYEILANASCNSVNVKSLLYKNNIHISVVQHLSQPHNYSKVTNNCLEAMYRILRHMCRNYQLSNTVVQFCSKENLDFLTNIQYLTCNFQSNESTIVQPEVKCTGQCIYVFRSWLGLVNLLIETLSLCKSSAFCAELHCSLELVNNHLQSILDKKLFSSNQAGTIYYNDLLVNLIDNISSKVQILK